MMKAILIVVITIALTGCSIFGRTKPVEIVTEEKERPKLQLDIPSPLKIHSTQWILITPENAEQVWNQLKSDGKHPVLFAVTSDGYEQLSMSMIDIRNYIATQRLIILQYQDYYEPQK